MEKEYSGTVRTAGDLECHQVDMIYGEVRGEKKALSLAKPLTLAQHFARLRALRIIIGLILTGEHTITSFFQNTY